MRIVEVVAHHVRIPLRKPIRHASYTRTESENLIIGCRLADGTQGYGEGVPREYVTGETIGGALELLRQSDLGTRLRACDPGSFVEAVVVADELALAPVAD